MAWDGLAWRSLGADGYHTEGRRIASDGGTLYLLYRDTYVEHGDLFCNSRLHLGVLDETTWHWFYDSGSNFDEIADLCTWDGGLAVGGAFQRVGIVSHGLTIWRNGYWERLGPSGQGVGARINALATDSQGVVGCRRLLDGGAGDQRRRGSLEWTGLDRSSRWLVVRL